MTHVYVIGFVENPFTQHSAGFEPQSVVFKVTHLKPWPTGCLVKKLQVNQVYMIFSAYWLVKNYHRTLEESMNRDWLITGGGGLVLHYLIG